jgi:hypothetical protein
MTGFRVYRFEVVDESSRNGANVVYNARDTADGSDLQLYEWTPPERDAASASAALVQAMPELDGAEVFSAGLRLYLAAPQSKAKSAFQILRSHGLFTGDWPGICEEPKTPVQPIKIVVDLSAPGAASTPGPKSPPGAVAAAGAKSPATAKPPAGAKSRSASSAALPFVIAALVVAIIYGVRLQVQMNEVVRERDAAEAEARSLKAQIANLQQTADSLQSQVKQKDDQLTQRQNTEAKTASTMFRLVEENLKSNAPYFTLTLHNECARGPLFVAVRYLSLQGAWVTRGWWKIDYDQREDPDVYSKDGVFYLYAEIRNANLTWTGSREPDGFSTTLAPDNFLTQEGQDLQTANPRTVVMFRRSATVPDRRLFEGFNCR